MPTNGWNEYKKLIMHELHENTETLKKLSTDITEMKSDISGLKVKATIAGGVAGILGTGIVTMLISAFK